MLLEVNMIYGYCRISKPQQSIERQKRNIGKEYPGAVLLCEAYTGTNMDRPEWKKLLGRIRRTCREYKNSWGYKSDCGL